MAEPEYIIVQPGLDGAAWLGAIIDGEPSPIGKVSDLLAAASRAARTPTEDEAMKCSDENCHGECESLPAPSAPIPSEALAVSEDALVEALEVEPLARVMWERRHEVIFGELYDSVDEETWDMVTPSDRSVWLETAWAARAHVAAALARLTPTPTGDALAPLQESQEDVIQRLAPTCTCPDDLCLGETGECGPCGEIDPEWDCLRVLARLGTAEGTEGTWEWATRDDWYDEAEPNSYGTEEESASGKDYAALDAERMNLTLLRRLVGPWEVIREREGRPAPGSGTAEGESR